MLRTQPPGPHVDGGPFRVLASEKPQMGDAGRGDGLDQGQTVQVAADIVKQPLPPPERGGDEADEHLNNETRLEILLRCPGATGERDVLPRRRAARLLERGVNAV